MKFRGTSISIRQSTMALATAFAVLLPGKVCAQDHIQPEEISALQHVSLLSRDNSNPAIAFSPDGKQLFVVWDGLVNGSRRILIRERIDKTWLTPVIVDTNPAGNNSVPSIAVDASGTPHVSWITTNANGQRVPVYARRISREPNSWYQQNLPLPADASSRSSCDFVNLQLDEIGKPWIVWQFGFGNVYSIACSRFNGEGEIASDELTPGAKSHNIYPELFFLPEPTVYWYMAESDQFYLIGSQYKADTEEWKLTPPENMEAVPASNLPDLFKTGRGPLAAIWYDRFISSDGLIDTDRIFVGIQDPASKGRGEAVNQANGSGYHSVAATGENQLLITTWIAESYEAGTQVILGVGENPGDVETVALSGEAPVNCENPKVSAAPDETAVVWEQNSGTSDSDRAIVLRSLSIEQ